MIIIFLTLLAWSFAIVGFGIILFFMRRKLSPHPVNERLQLVELFFGLLVLATLASAINFFVAITPLVVVIFLLIGWWLCWLRLVRIGRVNFSKGWLIFLFVWLAFVSFWATQPPRNPDSGLYHIQSIRWINENRLPLGLANLHQRFGFNTFWFPLASALTLPVAEWKEVNCFSVSALLVYFFGIAVAKAVLALRKDGLLVQDLYLSLSMLVVLGTVFRRNISSPSPDLAVLILCILLVYFGLQALNTTANWAILSFQLILLALFAVTIKFTAIPLLLIPLTVLIFARSNQIPISWKRLFAYCLVFGGVIGMIWLFRGIALSGCVAFPIAESCSKNLAWSIPRSMAKEEWMWDQAVARNLISPVILGWDWLSPWFSATLGSLDFVLPVVLIFASFILLLKENFSSPALWLSFPLLLGITFWFFTAPDIRFAAGYFWALSLLLTAVAVEKHFRRTRSVSRIVFTIGVLLLVVMFPLRNLLHAGLPPVFKIVRNSRQFLLTLPLVESKTKTRLNQDGVPIRVPVDGSADCWFSELPCAPIFYERLRIEKTSDGQFSKFYFP